jgi:hypothetical protein
MDLIHPFGRKGSLVHESYPKPAMFHVFTALKAWYSAAMANRLLPPVLTRRRIWIACGVALIADGVQVLLGPMGWFGADEVLDIAVMSILTLTLGFHPLFLPTFIVEFIPGVDDLPTWTACALIVIGLRRKQSTARPPKSNPPPPQPSGPIIDI